VLIAVLIVIAVLSLAAYQFTELMTAEYRSAVREADARQAKQAAVSGIHYAAAMLSDRDSYFSELGGNPFLADSFDFQIVKPGASPRSEARFHLVSVVNTGPGVYESRWGAVVDESSKLNVNALIQQDPSGVLLAAALTTLQTILQQNGAPCAGLLTPDVIDNIVDWVDPDDDPRTNGNESSYYLGLPGGGYRCKNGPLNSLDEMLLIKGVTPQLLYGNDRNRNGMADDDPNAGPLDRGLADYLTVYGRELNLDANGVLRENVNESEDLQGLYERLTTRVGADLAAYILAYKIFTPATVSANTTTTLPANAVAGSTADVTAAVEAALAAGTATNKRRLKSLLDLMNTQITLPKPAGAPQDAPTVIVQSPLNDSSKLPALIGILYDAMTTTVNVELAPRININTAPKEVLMTLTSASGSSSSSTTGSTATSATGLQESDIDTIIAQRDNQNPSDPAYLSGTWIVAAGLSPAAFKLIENNITGRTMTFRVHSVGYFGEGGPVARVEAVIDTNQGAPRILYFRDLTELDIPRGFEPPR